LNIHAYALCCVLRLCEHKILSSMALLNTRKSSLSALSVRYSVNSWYGYAQLWSCYYFWKMKRRHTIDPSYLPYLLSLLCLEGYLLLGAVCLLVAATETCHGSRQRHAVLEILSKRKDCRVQWPDDERQNKLSELRRKQEPIGYS
jgi:hypothetical protein